MNACPKCGHTHAVGDVAAVSRFTGVTGYRTPDGQVYETRDQAQDALCRERQMWANERDRIDDANGNEWRAEA